MCSSRLPTCLPSRPTAAAAGESCVCLQWCLWQGCYTCIACHETMQIQSSVGKSTHMHHRVHHHARQQLLHVLCTKCSAAGPCIFPEYPATMFDLCCTSPLPLACPCICTHPCAITPPGNSSIIPPQQQVITHMQQCPFDCHVPQFLSGHYSS